jgi:hypothetical protein
MNLRQSLTAFSLFAVSLMFKDCIGCGIVCPNVTNPNLCLNTISVATEPLLLRPFSTSEASDVKAFQCGSRNVGMNDFATQFAFDKPGIYEISTLNLNPGGDTVLQIDTCNARFVICNDDISFIVS